MNRRLIAILLALALALPLTAQELPAGFEADTVEFVRPRGMVNDYSMLGVNFGPTWSRLLMNPSGYRQGWLYNPWYVSVSYIKYMKMFDFLPYFGYQIGLGYGHEGYKFTENEKTHYQHRIDGATEASYSIVEVPFLIHGHVDFQHFKLMLNVGPYVGYRLSVERRGQVSGDSASLAIANSFIDHDLRWDYGLYAGLGFALVFDPVELHFNAMGHAWSWGSIYTPNSNPEPYTNYYYRFAYPLDLNFTVGIYFQLGKRYGKTNAQLRRQAYDIVYGEDNGQNR